MYYVVETFWMQEAAVREELRHRDFDAIYPTYMAHRRERDKIVKVERPLFGPYLFVAFDVGESGWKVINRVRGVRKIMGAKDGTPLPLVNGEAERLLERCASGPLEACEEVLHFVKSGQAALIISGMFEGLSGRCKQASPRRQRAVVELDLLGGYQEVDLPIQWLKPLDGPGA